MVIREVVSNWLQKVVDSGGDSGLEVRWVECSIYEISFQISVARVSLGSNIFDLYGVVL